MTENTALWDKLGKTDPSHTKTFKRAGGFSGTAIKPMWSYRRMTEEFGPCGVGWGINQPSFQVVPNPASEEILVYCTVAVWHGERDRIVFGVGGDKVAGKNKFGAVTDDEAFKKAFTDAVTNALKLIGVGADVHMGMFDDNKYVNTMKQEFADDHKAEAKPASAPKNDKARETFAALQADMRQCKIADDLRRWWSDDECKKLRATLPEDWQANLRQQWAELGRDLADKEKAGKIRDTVEAIKDAFPGSTVTDERITDASGRELENI